MVTVWLIAFYVLIPVLIIYICSKFSFFNKIGAVVIAYGIGLIIGNVGILPEESETVQEWITTITIPLAIPLLIFSTNIRKWLRLAGKTILSMFLALIGLVFIIVIGYFILKEDGFKDFWKVSGMLVGVYTGGTPNMASIKMILNVDENTYIITHTYDILISSFYLLFLISIGPRVFRSVLLAFKPNVKVEVNENSTGTEDYRGMLQKKNIISQLKALLLAVLVFGVGGGISYLVDENSQMVVAILLITSLGIAFSFVPYVNKIEKSFELGMYFIIVFCLVVASMADASIFAIFQWNLFFYIFLAIFGTLLLHILFSILFKVDADTVMITSTALVCSPPFVPVIVGVLKNREVLVSGLTVGIIGYAIGNYMGYFIAVFLSYF